MKSWSLWLFGWPGPAARLIYLGQTEEPHIYVLGLDIPIYARVRGKYLTSTADLLKDWSPLV